ncbi:lysine--tRNA ligase [Candidatus Erwinia haradaeae]|uniref:Lysine--tRNA ligase n=1 Tax=Candidatus Erwinia haradaeae TaxID=1922217 RepID=A0A451D2J9_9GAMM|nr:lysine--tRNA ligase [Candidatus Erwinia haradaeae]VFP79863.1 Lysine--tRNA ligase [Candidatus Erwinia haradaeae]
MFQKDQKDLQDAPHYNNELQKRREKLSILRKEGVAFPNDFHREHISSQLHDQFDQKEKIELKALNIKVSVAGRIITRRIMGKTTFITLQDTGGRIQLYLSRNNFLENIYTEYLKKLDLGDIIGAKGIIFKTNTGELSIFCNKLCLLTKALRPLPDKFHGLVDQETRYRQRYLDLITNPEVRKTFQIRSKLISGIRKFMVDHEFLEVETPMMQTIPGGASARPFVTYHNALNIDMYLRVSPELYLKRLMVGGFDRIFEINRNFRNEGISPRHNPEFTMMELYMAYANYTDLMQLVETLFSRLAEDILGSAIIQYGEHKFCLSQSFQRLTMKEAIIKYNPDINLNTLNNFKSLTKIAHSLFIKIEDTWGIGRIITEIFEKTVEERLIQPTFITEYPVEVSPLARSNDINTEITDRFELFIGGREICNGFSELNDPEDQKKRFLQQSHTKEFLSEKKEMFYDEDYISALEYGLPPCAGLGIGIDRMVMIFTNIHTIRDVILFPLLRPDSNNL